MMDKKEAARQHYSLPQASDLEKGIAKEYKKGFACIPSYLEGFGSYLFPMRIPSEDLKDSHESRGATDLYDEALLEVYGLALAKSEIAAYEATEENARAVLDNILGSNDDFFLNELQKKNNWQKYLTVDCITAWYDDKRRAALRGLAKKGIVLQEKAVPEKPIVPEAPKQKKHWPLYTLVISNLAICAGIAASQVIGYLQLKKFEEKAESIELRVNNSVNKLEENLEPENLFERAENYLRSDKGQEQANRLYVEFKDWWKKEDLAVDQFDKFWQETVLPALNDPEQSQRNAEYITNEFEKRYKLKTTADQLKELNDILRKFAKLFGQDD